MSQDREQTCDGFILENPLNSHHVGGHIDEVRQKAGGTNVKKPEKKSRATSRESWTWLSSQRATFVKGKPEVWGEIADRVYLG